ncbi:MarR family winged helix-turn-helix transcriptional regulator [Ferrimonas sp. SCSIO 43195]|uniref:MarR family winged helix-turn-helix transcriptional regulator n=1 Tax=Ferrimonas sp. SCSIO 43195 TaxID=2822844 RepID=UPI0020752334|nr:MarR family transcriptional regulator [Ferrimonas sp. SCSIO 43195]USD38030.1 MarR family transcriptional regulator [Ferrimonas sp. SCSIO 43195]
MTQSITSITALDNSMTFLMSLAQKQYRALCTQRLMAEFDISLEMVGAMRALQQLGCIPQQQLADVLKRNRSVAKRLVDNGIKRGLIEASKSDTNKKARMLSLTAEGHRVNEACTPVIQAISEEFFAGVTLQEQQQLMGILKKLVRDDVRVD